MNYTKPFTNKDPPIVANSIHDRLLIVQLQTCNRSELYAVTVSRSRAIRHIGDR